MRDVLALLLAGSSSVIGAVVGRMIRPYSRVAMAVVVGVAVGSALVAEGASVLVVGAPRVALEPTLAGLVLGGLAAYFSGRRPPDGDQRRRR